MSLKLRKATVSDASSLAEVYFSAFSTDSISLLVFPRDEQSYKFWNDMLAEELAEPSSHFICIYDSSLPSLPIVSFAKWNDPSAPLQTMDQLPSWPENGDSELANHFFGTLFRKHHDLVGDIKHWYLETLATRKEYQGKGAAGQLLRWGLERADEDGVVTFLEASPEGKPIYEKYGFREMDRLVVDLKGKGGGKLEEKEFVEVFMIREAMKKS